MPGSASLLVARGEPAPGSRSRAVTETLLAKGAELASQALLVLALPRVLGPADYGQFAVAFGAMSLVALALGPGTALAAVRYVPASAPGERLAVARSLAGRAVTVRARMLAGLTAAALALPLVSPSVPLVAVVAVCAATWFSVASTIAAEVALAVGRRRVWNARFVLENALVVAGGLAGRALAGIDGAIVGIAVASATTLALILPRVLRDLRGAPARGPLPAGAAAYARFQTLSAIIVMSILRAGPLTVGALGGASTQVGYAALATGVTAAAGGILGSLFDVQLPRLAETARDRPAAAEAEAQRIAIRALAVATALAVPAAAVAGRALHVVLGSGFVGARSAVVIALAVVPLAAVSGFAELTASLRLRPGLLAWSWGCGGVAFALTTVVAVPPLGARGAAMAVLAGCLTACLVATGLLGRRVMLRTALPAVGGAVAVLAAGALTA